MCEYCEKGWGIPDPDTNRFWEQDINFCPMCGEPLKEPEPLTLDELKARDRRPVWISDGEFCGWAIFKLNEQKQVAHCNDNLNISHYMQDYGKTWLAFDREATVVVKRYLEGVRE